MEKEFPGRKHVKIIANKKEVLQRGLDKAGGPRDTNKQGSEVCCEAFATLPSAPSLTPPEMPLCFGECLLGYFSPTATPGSLL